MNIKEKTALLATCLNVFLTVIKFTTFFLTGSIAILAESWHSFSDIASSFLVYLSVKSKEKKVVNLDNDDEKNRFPSLAKRIRKFVFSVTLEQKVSLLIGGLLFYVAINIFKRIFLEATPLVEKAVVPAGLILILFSLGSYFIYKLETLVGEKTNSLGLISDGIHAKSDMIASLACGFSLILYAVGVNLDKIVGGIIGFLIFSLSLEIIVNVFISVFKEDAGYIKIKADQIFILFFDKKVFLNFINKIDSLFNLKLKDLFIIKNFKGLFFLTVCIIYSLTTIICINTDEEGILERFGKPVSKLKALTPGLHFKYPWPIDKLIKIKSKKIYQLNIGNTTDKNKFALLWTQEHGAERPFLSGDNNFFYSYLVIHYKIGNIFDFYYKHKDIKFLLEEVSNKVIAYAFLTKSFYETATSYRKDIEQYIGEKLQKELNTLESGIEIINVSIKDTHPPTFIADSFERVIAAFQNKQEMINNAYSYRNRSLPESRGQAFLEKELAYSYVEEIKQKAIGESKRFEFQLESFSFNRSIYSLNFYLEAIREALRDKNLIVVDSLLEMPEIWLNFSKIEPNIPMIGGKSNQKIISSIEDQADYKESSEEYY